MPRTYEEVYNEHPDYVALRDKTGRTRLGGVDYGMEDKEGHLRAYSKEDAFKMFVEAGLSTVRFLEAQYMREPVFADISSTSSSSTQLEINCRG